MERGGRAVDRVGDDRGDELEQDPFVAGGEIVDGACSYVHAWLHQKGFLCSSFEMRDIFDSILCTLKLLTSEIYI